MKRFVAPLAAAVMLALANAAWAQTPRVFRDCPDCPEMVVVPGGSFLMGAPDGDPQSIARERPQHPVDVPAFALGRTHVTRGQFARFVAASGYRPEPGRGCYFMPRANMVAGNGPGGWSPRRTWRWPGFAQTDDHPVVCVTFNDAQAYVSWIARRTRVPYRLPSEAEWEYAARAGAPDPQALRPAEECRLANTADLSFLAALRMRPDRERAALCRDGYTFTAPVGRFRPNRFGLHDMYSNADQWIADCLHESYEGAPTDGSAWLAADPLSATPDGGCRDRVARGGYWGTLLREFRLTTRGGASPDSASWGGGIRVARSLP